jgi:hypothetical protein
VNVHGPIVRPSAEGVSPGPRPSLAAEALTDQPQVPPDELPPEEPLPVLLPDDALGVLADDAGLEALLALTLPPEGPTSHHFAPNWLLP